MIDSWLYKIASRRRGGRTQPAEEVLSSAHVALAARRAKVVRRTLLVVLVTIGVASFVEVVLFPGALIRRSFAPQPAAAAEPAAVELPPLTPALLFANPAEQHRQEDLRRQRSEDRVREAHEALGAAVVAAQTELQRSRAAFSAQFETPAGSSPQSAPPALVPLLAEYTTARLAWNNLVTTWADADSAIASALSLHRLGAERLAADSYLPEDEREFIQAAQRLHSVSGRLTATRSDLNHLAVLIKARAAATHQLRQVQTSGGSQ